MERSARGNHLTGPYSGIPWSIRILALGYLLTPVWWLLGIEQFIWLPLGLIGLLLLKKIRITAVSLLYFLFLAAQVLSAINIEESFRYWTFLRSFMANVSGFLLLLIIVSEVGDRKPFTLLLRALTFAVLSSASLGVLAEVLSQKLQFHALLASLFPDSWATTSYGSRIVTRSIGNDAYFQFIGKYIRLSGFWLFATTYAMALIAALPIILGGGKLDPRFKKFYQATGLLGIVNLIFTTGRMALLGFTTGFLYYKVQRFLTASRLSAAAKRWVNGLTALFIALLVLFASLWITSTGDATSLAAGETNLIQEIIKARGEGSYQTRLKIYIKTLGELPKHPLIGWGTERDTDELPYPLGSHSYFLGLTFRHGLLSLSIFVLLIAVIWMTLSSGTGSSSLIDDFILRVKWAILALLINGVTDAWDLDGFTFAVIWTVIALGLTAKKSLSSQTKDQVEPYGTH